MNPNINPKGVKNPFRHFCMSVGAIPTSYKESLSYYETLLYLIRFLEDTVIPAIDNNAQALEELQGLFIQLKNYVENYFDNLDVQEEINNKLDDMVEQGTLQEIIADYLNSKAVFGFDNVASMKEATNLIDGSYAETLGYYSVNDGGGATYKIREITNDDVVDNATIIPLHDDNLIAELIIKGEINLSQFGAKGDGITDDTDNIQKSIEYAHDNNLKLTSNSNKTYVITETLNISNCNCDFNNAKFITSENIDIFTINTSTYYTYLKNVFIDCNNVANSGINIINGKEVRIDNFTIANIYTYGINYLSGFEIIVNKGNLYNTTSNNAIGIRAMSSDSHFTDIIIKDLKTGVYNRGNNFYTRVHGWLYNTDNLLDSKFFLLDSTWCYLDSCYSDTYHYSIYSKDWGKAKITNLVTYYNSEVMNSETFTDNPYLYYIEQANSDVYLSFINCRISGLADNNCKISNNENNYIKATFVNCSFFNTTKNYSYETWSPTVTGVTVSKSILQMKNDSREIYLEFLYDVSNGRSISLGSLPDNYRPKNTMTLIANYSTSEWEVDGICYCYIASGGNITVKLPSDVVSAGDNVYIRIFIPIINNQDF